jgi:tetratricopeptide (TPR) repeat protein
MATDDKRRQQKLAKKSAKRKAQLAARKSDFPTGGNLSPLQAVRFPVTDCLVPDTLFEAGMGQIFLTRALPDGRLAVACFLLDVYCLGVKNAFYRIVMPHEFDHFLQSGGNAGYQQVEPSCLRKLVEGAAHYAEELGFMPHRDYARAAQLFGDIDAAACPVQYTYGKDGKPLYISGPYDNPQRIRRIYDTLAQKLGQDEFHYLIDAQTATDVAGEIDSESLTFFKYEITEEPIEEPALARLPESVKKMLGELYNRLLDNPGDTVPLLQSLRTQYPDVPMIYNYLYVAYDDLGDRANAGRMLEETLERFPNYLFGRIAYANECLDQGQVERVSEILEGKFDLRLLYPERNRFNVSEVTTFSTLMAKYFHRLGDRDRAEMHYEILRRIAPDHPNTRIIGRLLNPSRLGKWARKLLGKR